MAAAMLPISAQAFMHIVGIVEIAVGLAVLLGWTRLGALVVVASLAAISINLVLAAYFDVAVRDLVMAVGAYRYQWLLPNGARSTFRALQQAACGALRINEYEGNVQRLNLRFTAAALDGPSDHELIARLREGEGAAFEKLIRRYNQRIFRAAAPFFVTKRKPKTWFKKHSAAPFTILEGFEKRSSVGMWLTRIAVNEALSRLRRSSIASLRSRHSKTAVPLVPVVSVFVQTFNYGSIPVTIKNL